MSIIDNLFYFRIPCSLCYLKKKKIEEEKKKKVETKCFSNASQRGCHRKAGVNKATVYKILKVQIQE